MMLILEELIADEGEEADEDDERDEDFEQFHDGWVKRFDGGKGVSTS